MNIFTGIILILLVFAICGIIASVRDEWKDDKGFPHSRKKKNKPFAL